MDDASRERQLIAHAFYDFGNIKPYQYLDYVLLVCDGDDVDNLGKIINRYKGDVFPFRVDEVDK